MDSETLTLLLRGAHVNIPERIERGLWPHPPLRFSDVVQHLANVLESEKWFPREWSSAVPGESVWEGGVIERQSSSKYIYRSQRHHPIHRPHTAVQGSTASPPVRGGDHRAVRRGLHVD